MKKNILYIFTLLLFLVACKTSVEKDFNKNKEVVRAINKTLDEKKLPGLNYSIVYEDGHVENYSVGYSDVEQREDLSINHTLFSGSIGKTYAVALVMELMESNKIKLQEKLITYFPDIEWLSKLPNINDITIEMLLQHTSGLPRYVLKPELWKVLHDNPNKVWTYKERLSYVFNDDPVHEAGKGWAYSDTNYILLGMLIEKVTSKNYYDLVRTKLIEPNNLLQTHPSLSCSIPNLATGYSNMGEAFFVPNKTVKNGQYFINPQLEWTGGGVASTTSDLAKWAKLYYEGKLFSQETLNLITTPNPNGVDVVDKGSYGMGSFIYQSQFGEAYGHSGFMPGFNAIFIYYPDKKIAAAVQLNCDYASAVLDINDLIDDLVLISITE